MRCLLHFKELGWSHTYYPHLCGAYLENDPFFPSHHSNGARLPPTAASGARPSRWSSTWPGTVGAGRFPPRCSASTARKRDARVEHEWSELGPFWGDLFHPDHQKVPTCSGEAQRSYYSLFPFPTIYSPFFLLSSYFNYLHSFPQCNSVFKTWYVALGNYSLPK